MATYWIMEAPSGDAGWAFGLPPGITSAEWPRHRSTGLPLVHGFTIRVPEEYRAAGPGRASLSYFHPGDSESFPSEEDQVARVQVILAGRALDPDEAGHPFWRALEAHARSRHPATVYYRDILDHDHAIVWHTAAELDGPRCRRPETPLPDGIDGDAMHLEDPVDVEVPLGFADTSPEHGYIQLGWPLHPVQNTEEELRGQGFGARVLEIGTDVGGANYGDGNCQVDLDNGLLDWACS